MSRYIRLPRTKQKKTDEFVSLVDHGLRIIARHKKAAVLAALFVVAGSFLLFYSGKKKESDLLGLNDKIYRTLQSENREESLKKLADEEGKEWLVLWSLFQEYLKEGKKKEAYDQLELLDGKIPSYLKPLYVWNKASLLWEEGKGADALSFLEQNSATSSLFNDDLLFLKGEILASLGKKEEAKKLFEELAADSPERDPLIRKKAGQRAVLLSQHGAF